MPLAAGFAAQILLGAMSFLVPLVLGGGPTILRGTQARMDSGNECGRRWSTPGL